MSLNHKRLPIVLLTALAVACNAAEDDSTRELHAKTSRAIDNIRFNKCPPIIQANYTWYLQSSPDYVAGVHKSIYPLLPEDYPIWGDNAEILKRETLADSVVCADPMDFALHGERAEDYVALVGGPHMPSSDPNAPYWAELEEVIDMQLARRKGDDPATFNRWPDLWKNYTLTDVALAVWNEYPASLQQELIVKRFKSTPRIEMNRTVFPFRSVLDMVGTQLVIASLNTWAIEAVGPVNFLLKWTYGVPRPEEMAWLISNKTIGKKDGVPDSIVKKIRKMKLTQAHDFTAYTTGSPNHPSWPAMHAAGSSCSYWLPAVAKLTAEEFCEALRIDYAVAYARTVSGVHYPMDNLAGLNIGQQVIKRRLPEYLATKYNANADVVAARLEQLSFNWHDFNPYDCTIESKPAGDRLTFD